MRKIVLAMTLVMVLGIVVSAEAMLYDRGGGLIYCDTLDITWLQDVNYAKTSEYDLDGWMTWDEAMTWANNLTYYDSVRDVIWGDWRLPTTVDGAMVFGFEGDPDGDGDYNYTYGYNLANSEMGHLFFNELGNKAYRATDGTSPQPGWGLSETGDFINLQPSIYWSSTEQASYPGAAWFFDFKMGYQISNLQDLTLCAWAVRDGDISAAPVPEPGTMSLIVMGLLGIVSLSKFGQWYR
ncbi:MAG: PEP-CTERM sorting domain-containing protein [Methanocellales archaeon]|nr:PEP-CTERM sorting domain-containing protein [Methanocellales archaeon]